jgi:hypothetical protein
MYLAIARDSVTLREPEVVTDLYASYTGRLTAEKLTAVLAEYDAGEIQANGAYLMVPVTTLRRLAAGRVPDGWDADFDRLLDRARDRGWLSEGEDAVRAPLERER